MHRFPCRLYYEDTDAGGVAYHAAYLRLAERARTEALRDAGAPVSALRESHGLAFVVRALDIRYRRPGRLDDLIGVTTATLAIGAAMVHVRQEFWRGSELLAGMRAQLACVDLAGRPARMPGRWREALAGM